MKSSWTVEKILREATDEIELETANIEGWKRGLIVDPSYSFEWSNEAFQSAARFKVAIILKSRLESSEGDDPTKLRKIVSWLYAEVMRGSLYPSFSTSVPDNLVATFLLQAHARWLDRLYSQTEFLILK